MDATQNLIQWALEQLARKPGYISRPNQEQLALILGDLIATGQSGAVEAPTGLGKSLAALIPAIAHAIVNKKRTVIATYTNVLADQYWRKDLPLALSLFNLDENGVPLQEQGYGQEGAVKTAFLIGRQRYICLTNLDEVAPDLVDEVRARAVEGTENEFRRLIRRPSREVQTLWQAVSAPPLCAARACPLYDDCYYFKARKKAEDAHIIITNHALVLQHGLMRKSQESDRGLLGAIDYVVMDEAHDLYAAAQNAFEFEIQPAMLNGLQAVSLRMERDLLGCAQAANHERLWRNLCDAFRQDLEQVRRELAAYGLTSQQTGILAVHPNEVDQHPAIKNARADAQGVAAITEALVHACERFVGPARSLLGQWEISRALSESAHNTLMHLQHVGDAASAFLQLNGVSVSYSGRIGQDIKLRTDVVGVDAPLKEVLWDAFPTMSLSATLTVDQNFDFYRRTVGCEPEYEEQLPSPFDYASNAALYLPPDGRIPDPTVARREGHEDAYFAAIARELEHIIRTCRGRTLALFHSRKEMEAVHQILRLPPELPVLMQPRSGAGSVGDQFKARPEASLFGLRSYWTGFDAPGETLSCVVLVRVPFEVPVEPPTLVRLAHLVAQGHDPFQAHTLPLAKMLVRQGAGRLIRRDGDKGLVAILDPRVLTKRYGEEILENLPPNMRRFRDVEEAVGWIGLLPDDLPLG